MTLFWARSRPRLRHSCPVKSRLRRNMADSLHDVAYNYIYTHGKDLHGEPLGKYFIHGLSHYVGLNVHDPK